MFNLFIRTVIIYTLVFAVMRLMGKRQISDMQPFDLVISLLIADVSSVPISGGDIPLLYGAVPILTLFMMHRLVSFLSLRSKRLRTLVCGRPVMMIDNGVVNEEAMRAANYTLLDLIEQLRLKDAFSISDVKYGILETNGSMSVLPNDGKDKAPSALLVSDGTVLDDELTRVGQDEKWLSSKLRSKGRLNIKDCLFVELDANGILHVQEKLKKPGPKARQYSIDAVQ